MNLQSSAEIQPNKKRIIVVTAIMAIIVMGLLIAAIVAASNKAKKPASSEVAIDATASQSTNQNTEKDASSENLAPVSNSESGSAQSDDLPAVKGGNSETSAGPVAQTTTELPATGPESLLPSILGAGALVTSAGYYLASRKALKTA